MTRLRVVATVTQLAVDLLDFSAELATLQPSPNNYAGSRMGSYMHPYLKV